MAIIDLVFFLESNSLSRYAAIFFIKFKVTYSPHFIKGTTSNGKYVNISSDFLEINFKKGDVNHAC